jgi:hypothetical protein
LAVDGIATGAGGKKLGAGGGIGGTVDRSGTGAGTGAAGVMGALARV